VTWAEIFQRILS